MPEWGSKTNLLHISGVKVEGRSGVHHSLERRIGLDGLVESIRLGYVLDNGKVQDALRGVWMCGLDVVGFLLAADRGDYGVPGIDMVNVSIALFLFPTDGESTLQVGSANGPLDICGQYPTYPFFRSSSRT